MTQPETTGLTIVRGPVCGCAVAFGEDGVLGIRILDEDAARTAAELEADVLERRPDITALPMRTPAGQAAADWKSSDATSTTVTSISER